MDWKDHLKPEEADRLVELNRVRAIASRERRRIRQRCEKRAERTKQQAADEEATYRLWNSER